MVSVRRARGSSGGWWFLVLERAGSSPGVVNQSVSQSVATCAGRYKEAAGAGGRRAGGEGLDKVYRQVDGVGA